jgi:hypothetical protein
MILKQQKHNDPVWNEESVEIVICSTTNSKSFSQVVSNAKGIDADISYLRKTIILPGSYPNDLKASLDAKVISGDIEGGWRITVAIPWKKVSIQPSDKALFFNVRRHRFVSGKREIVSWTEEGVKVLDPSSMGLLLLK